MMRALGLVCLLIGLVNAVTVFVDPSPSVPCHGGPPFAVSRFQIVGASVVAIIVGIMLTSRGAKKSLDKRDEDQRGAT